MKNEKNTNKYNTINYSENDTTELNELLKDPLLRDMIPKKHRKRRNQ